MNAGQRGGLIGALTKHLGGDENRHLSTRWLFGRDSTKNLDAGEWWALWKWVGFFQVDNEWMVDGRFSVECALVLTEALRGAKGEGVVDESGTLYQLAAYMDGTITEITKEDQPRQGHTAKFPPELIPDPPPNLKKSRTPDFLDKIRPPKADF